jgi:hypothetical protein
MTPAQLAALKTHAFKPGQSGNPGGRPPTEAAFRRECRKFVDEHVLRTWQEEVLEKGERWLEASRLLAAYGYGLPKEAPANDGEEAPETPTAEQAAAAAAELRGLDS